jgi:hypothetical protein
MAYFLLQKAAPYSTQETKGQRTSISRCLCSRRDFEVGSIRGVSSVGGVRIPRLGICWAPGGTLLSEPRPGITTVAPSAGLCADCTCQRPKPLQFGRNLSLDNFGLLLQFDFLKSIGQLWKFPETFGKCWTCTRYFRYLFLFFSIWEVVLEAQICFMATFEIL